jgi:hypothetical protein
MANRNQSYDEVIAKKFENVNYAQEYILNIVRSEKLSVEDGLRETIKAMGLQNFATKAKLSIQAVSDFIAERQKWSTDKIAKHIEEVFHLKVKLSLEDPEDKVA